ncbi:MAG: hypothetical protein WC666_03335 [Candidatus Paceibacterota bacterium]|jgi:hypothetical protein
MITTKFTTGLTRKQVSLDIQETKCILIHAMYFLGVCYRKTKEEFYTLLNAENRFDELCTTYERLGYDRTD